jgi:HEAT repeat protein
VKVAVPLLAKALANPLPRVRREAAVSLGKLGPKSKAAVDELRIALGDESPDVRLEVIVALAEIGAASESAIPDLVDLLSSPDPGVRQPAGYALGRIGPAAKSAIPMLRRLIQSRDRHDQSVAAWALVHITPDPDTIKTSIPLLVLTLQKAGRSEVRVEVARTLGQIGKGSDAVQKVLKSTSASDTDEAVRKAAAEALEKLK